MAGQPASPRGGLQEMIYEHYKEALEALPLEHIPALALHLLDAGVCFGFADPVTNIIANTLCLVPDEDGEPDTRCDKRRKKMTSTKALTEARAREDLLSKIAAGDVPSPPEARTIAERSLRGLVIFLTSYFRHLSTEDAMRYLCLARADLLVAVRLIEVDRCLRQKYQFCISSHTTKFAIRCAALAAGVSMVDNFIDAMFRIVPHLKLISQTVAAVKPQLLSLEDVRYLSGLVKKPLEVQKLDNPMDIADLRIRNKETEASVEKVPVQLIESMRGVLLDRVHELYLKAVSRLPMKEFQISYHRGLLKAGYCYGPFSPICNIIVNTIWYNTAFPASEEFKVDVISTMRHVESRSLNGLVAFLCASFPPVSKDEAMFYLLKSDLKVRKAIQMINREHVCSDERGYKAAADASSHPMPEEFLEFVVQYLPKVLPSVRSLMKASHLISPDDIIRLSSLLTASAKPLDPPVELTNNALNMLSNHKKNFLTEQSTIRAKVEAALQKYEEVKGCPYELNMIYVVNSLVGKVTNIRSRTRQYSHVNFWATRKNGERPTLFFAQFSNDVDSKNVHSICYPVTGLSTHDARCCYCEFEGLRIVHPIQPFWDGGSEFEKISCGEHKITTERSIGRGKLMDNDIGGLFKQHYIYLDPIWDCKLIPSINDIAWKATLTWEEQIRDDIDRSRRKVN